MSEGLCVPCTITLPESVVLRAKRLLADLPGSAGPKQRSISGLIAYLLEAHCAANSRKVARAAHDPESRPYGQPPDYSLHERA